jgi:hypothetical protein
VLFITTFFARLEKSISDSISSTEASLWEKTIDFRQWPLAHAHQDAITHIFPAVVRRRLSLATIPKHTGTFLLVVPVNQRLDSFLVLPMGFRCYDEVVKGAENKDNDQDNTTRYRGVYHERDKGLWRARIYWRGAHTTIGRFPTAESAARAHDRASIYVFGAAAAVTNFTVVASSCSDARQLTAGLRDNVVARLVRLRSATRQAAHDPSLQKAREARARRLVAASKALGAHRSVEPTSSRESLETLHRLVQSSRWQALILAAVLAPSPPLAISE